MTPPLQDRERREAEALEAWALHHQFIRHMETAALLSAEKAADLKSEESRKIWLRTFLGSPNVY